MFHHGGIKRQRRKRFLSPAQLITVLLLSFSPYLVQPFVHVHHHSRRLLLSSSQAVLASLLREIDDVEDIQEGTIVLSRVESRLGCHDLKQTYLHKAVVLISLIELELEMQQGQHKLK